MIGLRSFRARLVVGSILWTAGLLPLAHLAWLLYMWPNSITLQVWHHAMATALVFMAAGLLQLRRGLSPFKELRARISSMSR